MIPSKVADVIDRQRQALSDRIRRESARRVAADRKARGELPGFMLAKKGQKAKKKTSKTAKGGAE